MKESKTMSLNEIFLIVITVASLLVSNGVLATSGKYACFYESGMTANAVVYQLLQ